MKKTAGLFLALLAGCSAPAPEPEGDRDALAAAFGNALGSAYLLARFEGTTENDVAVKGTARWYRSGVLLVDMDEKGGGRVRLLKIGAQAWIFDASAQAWIAARPAQGIYARGLANPYELVSSLNAEVRAFRSQRGGFVWNEAGAGGRELLDPLLRLIDIDPEAECRLGIRVEVKAPDRMRIGFSGRVLARLCFASVEIRSSATPPPMQFDDIPSPFTPEMKAAVRKATEEK